MRRGGITRQVRAGKPEFCGLPPVEARAGETLVAVAWDGEPRTILRCRDRLRPEAAEVIEALAARGLTVMLVSGDRPEAVEAVTGELRLDGRYAGMSPDEKAALVAELRAAGRTVMMVGDGINDSPALAAADVGVAMSGGTELAREASEVTLIGDDLTRLPALFDLAGETDRRVRWNLAWAFGYNLLLLAIAFLGWLHPLLAAALMLASSFVLLGNSLAMPRTGDRQGAAGSGANGAIAGADG